MDPETFARVFHETYERLAPAYQWPTVGRRTACAWVDLPANNRALMVATATELLELIECQEAA
jgi:hypothetical protein